MLPAAGGGPRVYSYHGTEVKTNGCAIKTTPSQEEKARKEDLTPRATDEYYGSGFSQRR